MKAAPIYLLSAAAIILISCGDSGTGKYESPRDKKSRKYHTEEMQGLWTGLADTHLPVVRYITEDKRIIEVSVPLSGSKVPFHYIEKIALLRDEKEIDSRTLTFAFTEPKINFVITDMQKGSYSVISKCNLHGMWRVDLGDLSSPETHQGK